MKINITNITWQGFTSIKWNVAHLTAVVILLGVCIKLYYSVIKATVCSTRSSEEIFKELCETRDIQ